MEYLLPTFQNMISFSNLLYTYMYLYCRTIKQLQDQISYANHQNHWKYSKFSMAHLREVELTGLTGTNCEFQFMKAILARAKRLHKVAISFNPNCWQHEGNMDAFECNLLYEGMWTSHRDAFTLNCVKCRPVQLVSFNFICCFFTQFITLFFA